MTSVLRSNSGQDEENDPNENIRMEDPAENVCVTDMDEDETAGMCLETPPEANKLMESLVQRILAHLSFRDLLMCRQVSKRWNIATNHSETFLSKTVFHLSLEPWNAEVVSSTKVSWRHVKLQLFDMQAERTEPLAFPDSSFLTGVTSLEFRQCILSWNTLKLLVTATPNLQHLTVRRCLFQDSNNTGLFPVDEAAFLRTIGRTKRFTFADVTTISTIQSCLEKLVVCAVGRMETLKVEYNPYFNVVSAKEAASFCSALGQLLSANTNTLRHLILDIRSTEILNFFCPIVLTQFDNYYSFAELEVFKLAAPTLGGPNVAINYDTPRALLMLSEFLTSLPRLKSVAFPHLQNLGPYEGRRWQLAESIPRSVQKLRVPGPLYLRRNFLKMFVQLRLLFIGEKTCPGPTGLLQPIKYIYDYKGGVVKAACRNVKELGIYAKVNYESGKLYHIIEKFPNLTRFEVDTFKALLNDKDVQAVVRFLPALQHLSVAHSDLISDHGLTGIPTEVCRNLFKLSTIYTETNLRPQKLRGSGRSLSELKGLKSLVLMGWSKVSDVGLRFGLEFNGLQTVHLPWSERITEWGIEKLGDQNPSLERLTLTGATPSSVLGLNLLLTKHRRLTKDGCRILSVQEQQTDEFGQPSLLTGILWDNQDG